MALRKIVTEGDPVLAKKCRPVEKIDQRLAELLDDLADTMHDAEGVGLAAPQVGILRRLCVVDVGEGVIELINPEIVESEGDQYEEEGCLSVPGRRGEVSRSRDIEISYISPASLKDTTERISGFTAVIFQHECDHLQGILYIDKL